MPDTIARPVADTDHEASQQARMAEGWGFLTGLLAAGLVAPLDLPADRPPLPLTILTGFLGTGKTTLVNRLLEHAEGRRILVLVNDFGAINIDEKLIADRTAGTLTLSNGCACCSLAGDLARKLRDITSGEVRPDVIVLEASGLSDPHGLAQVAATNAQIRIDGIVTVLDAEAVRAQYDAPATAELVRQQLAGADLLVLNKLDLLAPAQQQATRDWLDGIVQGRPVVPAVRADVPTSLLLDIGRTEPVAPAGPADHLQYFESVSVQCTGRLDRARVRTLLTDLHPSVVRVKGLLALADDAQKQTVFQRVGKRWSFERGAPVQVTVSSLVVIAARGALSQQTLQLQLEACRV